MLAFAVLSAAVYALPVVPVAVPAVHPAATVVRAIPAFAPQAVLAEHAALLNGAAATRGTRVPTGSAPVSIAMQALSERAKQPAVGRGPQVIDEFVTHHEQRAAQAPAVQLSPSELAAHEQYLTFLSNQVAERLSAQQAIAMQGQQLSAPRSTSKWEVAKQVAIFGGVAGASSIPIIMYQDHLQKVQQKAADELARQQQAQQAELQRQFDAGTLTADTPIDGPVPPIADEQPAAQPATA